MPEILPSKGMNMLDAKAAGGLFVAMTVTASTWVEQANEYGTLITTIVGIIVGCATAWYMILKARQLRRKIKRDQDDGTK